VSDEKKTPARPGSKWATGKRRVLDPKFERLGFSKGARVSRSTTPTSKPARTRHRSRK
jgi:hypothetical protein